MAIAFIIEGEKGAFRSPDARFQKITDELDEALDKHDCGTLSDTAYIAILTRLVEAEPDFIDGYAHLGAALFEQGRIQKALEIYLRGVSVGEHVLPTDYAGQIPWLQFDNRPFLRALHGAVCCLMRLRRHEETVSLIEKILRYNPNDNQGVRYLLGSEYLRLGRMQAARHVLEKEAPHYPPYQYELALLHMEQAEMVAAATCLRRGFLANGYIAEILSGNLDPAPLLIWHGDSHAKPEFAQSYVDLYGEY